MTFWVDATRDLSARARRTGVVTGDARWPNAQRADWEVGRYRDWS